MLSHSLTYKRGYFMFEKHVTFNYCNNKPDCSGANSPELTAQMKKHIYSMNGYFSLILGKEIKNASDVTSQDMVLLKEAYDKSHVTKNFEIELYWKRSTYSWSLIAALLTICGFMINAYLQGNKTIFLPYATLGLAAIGIITTIICNHIAISGEYWKKNWELHTILLEPFFSGNLYSTHLFESDKRYSIARLSTLLLSIVLLSWITLAMVVFAKLTTPDYYKLAYSLCGTALYVIFCNYFVRLLTKSKNKTLDALISFYNLSDIPKK